jgi:hypothetical protein
MHCVDIHAVTSGTSGLDSDFNLDVGTATLLNDTGVDWFRPTAQVSYPASACIVGPLWAGVDGNTLMLPPVFDHELTIDSNPHPTPSTIHSIDTTSAAPACFCGKTFSRNDARNRHIRTASRRSGQASSVSNTSGLYPCNLCDKHQGYNGFKRRDHLRQHLGVKGYHKMSKEAIDKYLDEYH